VAANVVHAKGFKALERGAEADDSSKGVGADPDDRWRGEACVRGTR
jgi:hypothetical protein